MKYPTRRAFVDLPSRPEFQTSHEHQDAGMDRTFVIGCQPIATPSLPDGWAQVDWADVPDRRPTTTAR